MSFTFNRLLLAIIATSLFSSYTVQAATVRKAPKKARICAECKSKAEGADKSAAARATQWTGTIIGVNFGEHSIVITEGTLIDHIKTFAQRSVRITSDTEMFKDGDPIAFENLDVGQRITAHGSYDAKKRIITADRVDVGVRVASVPATPKPEKAAATEIGPSPVAKTVSNTKSGAVIKRNLQVGSSGVDVTALQKFLSSRGYLVMPRGASYGTFGSGTQDALKKYQKAVGLPVTGTVGPQTRARLSKG